MRPKWPFWKHRAPKIRLVEAQCAYRKHCYPETPLGSPPTSGVSQLIHYIAVVTRYLWRSHVNFSAAEKRGLWEGVVQEPLRRVLFCVLLCSERIFSCKSHRNSFQKLPLQCRHFLENPLAKNPKMQLLNFHQEKKVFQRPCRSLSGIVSCDSAAIRIRIRIP